MSDEETRGRSRVTEIYVNGLAEVTPDVPVGFEELERAALDAMDEKALGYVKGSAGGERTAANNEAAFDRWRIEPEMLKGVESRDLSVEAFGTEFDVPVMLAPIGCQSIVHEDGELASARAAAAQDVPMCLSTVSSYAMEEVADELGDTPRWFQFYWSPDRDLAASFLDRAEDAGYEAVVVTVDTPLVGWRPRDLENAYLPYLEGVGIANYTSDDAFVDRLDHAPEENTLATAQAFLDTFGDASLTWDDLDWLHDNTDLPVVVKGILSAADARRALEHGADGVVVSNHGGRQVDGSVAALEALPRVVDEVGDEAFVGFDSGVRRGADALKALALGADLVLLGRPYVYGLALEGAAGVEAVLANFLADFDLSLGLAGHDSVAGLDRDALTHESELP
ncbi:alpha-hydroxy-acid oxidizing protein [Halosegnis marinus]|uniref:Alpha-hydroxy-acid oxidizing protein n=1 Tax=Halosegnis marinus TaxID=3034023 RepID=A0ABD5ZS37_9EURY|nr:alpha-hydroxy-acid oxidizing protein [Halosegnis sp. DT85]